MKILFMGHGKWACITLAALKEAGHEILGVVCELDLFDKQEEEHYKRFASKGFYESLKEKTLELKLNLLQPEDINSDNFLRTLKALAPELIVMISYHAIVKEPLLKLFSNKIINVHGAPLSNYRGRAPINWAIINGETQTGVTVHYVEKEIDKGAIIAQELIPITYSDTAFEVLEKTLQSYPKLTLKAVDLIKNNKVKPKPQNIYEGYYFPKRTPEDGRIDWSWKTRDIYNFVRALTYPYPGAFTFYKNKKLFVWGASEPEQPKRITPVSGLVFGKTKEGYVKVTTADSYLILKRVQFEGEEEKAPEKTLREGVRL